MNTMKELNSMKLLEHVKEVGLLNSNLSLKCVHCKAVFPEEYSNCPQCKTNRI